MKLGKKSADAAAPRRGGRISLILVGAALLLLTVGAFALAVNTLLGQLESTRVAAQRQLDERTGQALAARFQQRLQADFATLAQIARQPQVIQAVSGAETARQALQQLYGAAFPGAQRLLVLPAGLREPDLQADPPLGFAALEMMRKAEQDKTAPPAEVHLPGQPAAHVNLLQPVVSPQGVVTGHLLLTFPMKYLDSALTGLPGGSAALRQGTVTLLNVGANGGGSEQRLPVAQSQWQLIYSAPAAVAQEGNPLLVPGAALAVLLLAMAGAFALLRGAIRRDGKTLVGMLQDMNAGNLQREYPARLAELAGVMAEVRREAARASAGQPVAVATPSASGDPVAPAAAAKPAPSVADELPPDILSGLEVHEEPEEPAPVPAKPAAAAPAAEPAGGMKLDPVILRAYDVRGVVGAGIDAEVMTALGRAIGSEAAAAGQSEVVVARDGRLSSPELAAALIEGLVASGRQVVDIGMVPTPVMNFATFHLGTGTGVMVTASHNPRDYNGLKIVIGGKTLSGDAIQALGRRVAKGDFVSGQGGVKNLDVLSDYVERIVQDVTLHKPLRLVVDCGNGVAGVVAPQVFRAMGCEVEELFCEVDGYFPNHHPDPTVPDNLDALISLVRLQGADLGLAFDGDGDRLGVVDAKGKIIWADRQLMLLARDVLTRHPGADIVFDVKCSPKLAQVIVESAGVPVMWKTGHSLIKGKLQEIGAPLGGEMSGHIFIKDRWYGFDDAIYAAARLLELISMDGRSSVEVFNDLPEGVATPEIRLDMKEGEPSRLMTMLHERLPKEFKEARVSSIDGVRADFPDGFGLVRASNTGPQLVLRFEADDRSSLQRIQELFYKHLRAVKPDLGV